VRPWIISAIVTWHPFMSLTGSTGSCRGEENTDPQR
jgi:hypothetical protein